MLVRVLLVLGVVMSTSGLDGLDLDEYDILRDSQVDLSSVPDTQPVPVEAQVLDGDEAQGVRRSGRIAQKRFPDPVSIDDWPVPRILEALYARGVSPPGNASHDQLFGFFSAQLDAESSVSVAEPPAGKRQCKRKNPAPAPSGPSSRKAKAPPPAGDKDLVLSALLDIKSSMSQLCGRVTALENPAFASSSSFGCPPPAAALPPPAAVHPVAPPAAVHLAAPPAAVHLAAPPAAVHLAAPVPPAGFSAVFASPDPAAAPGFFPQRTLGTAVPAVARGDPFISPHAAIPMSLRNQIVAGNDINFVKILCASDLADNRVVDCGGISITLKDSDPRLLKSLTLAEFTVAFGVFRDVLCERFPERRVELDTYLAIVSDLAMSYGGTLFYEYHKSFSSKAALYLQRFNTRLDWSVFDLELFGRLFAGHKSESCNICGSFNHSPNLCPRATPSSSQAPTPAPVHKEVKRRSDKQPPLCINFNESVCVYPKCKYQHICSTCGDSHPRAVCPRRSRPSQVSSGGKK